ncbi:MAG: 23S rRNA pseudouridine(955/2504/2580) synthase [Proteobacteria bacterium]|nr:23S rRNA pseudouridine(955/2504/2580) synthase [Pseudomonadota bacterium]
MSEVQLTCGAVRRVPLARPNYGRRTEYTVKITVETVSYAEVEVPEDDSPAPRGENTHASDALAAESRGRGHGVRHFEVEEAEAGQRLDKYLVRRLGDVPRTRIFRIIRRGEVRVNGRRAGPEARLSANDRVRVPPLWVSSEAAIDRPGGPGGEGGRQGAPVARLGPPPWMVEAVGRAIVQGTDRRLLVLDKPAGIAVHGGSGISFGVIEALRALKPGEPLELAHRLDRDTSGCLLVTRDAATLRIVHALLREGQCDKRYLVLVAGKWDLGHKRIDVPLRTDTRVGGERTVRADASGKPSVSDFRPVQFFGKVATLMEVALHTGRTHQIRVHATYAGHPVAGDEKYGDAEFNARMRDLGLKRMFLHAHSMSFEWPQGAPFSASAPLPPELAAVLDRLGDNVRAAGKRRGAGRRPAR